MLRVYIWSAIERFGTNAVSLIGSIVLARLLAPGDFGIIGLIAIFSSIATTLYDSGMSDSIIRKPNIKDIDYNTIFYFNLILGLFLAIILFLLSPVIAAFFNNEMLIPLLKFYSAGIALGSFCIVPFAKLRKELRQDTLSKISISSTLVSLFVGIACALLGMRYWSLAIQQVSFPVILIINTLIYTSWRPKLQFSTITLKKHLPYSINYMFGYILSQIGRNINSVIIGKFFPIKTMGFYTQAQKINDVFSFSMEATLVTSSFTLIAQDKDRNQSIITKLNFISYGLSIIFGTLILLSKPIILVLLGDKWIESGTILPLIFSQSVFMIINNYYISVLKFSEKPKLVWAVSLVEKAMLVLFLLLFYRSQIETLLAIAIIITSLFSFIFSYFVSKETTIELKKFIPLIIRSSIILLISGALTTLSKGIFPINDIVCSILSALIFLLLNVMIGELFSITPYQISKQKLISLLKR